MYEPSPLRTFGIKSVCITINAWNSKNTGNFLSVTAHCENSSYELKSTLLPCKAMQAAHTATNLADELKSSLSFEKHTYTFILFEIHTF